MKNLIGMLCVGGLLVSGLFASDDKQEKFDKLYANSVKNQKTMSLETLSTALGSFELPGKCEIVKNEVTVSEFKTQYLQLAVKDSKGEITKMTLSDGDITIKQEEINGKKYEVIEYQLNTTHSTSTVLDWFFESKLKEEIRVLADPNGFAYFDMGYYKQKSVFGKKYWKRTDGVKCK